MKALLDQEQNHVAKIFHEAKQYGDLAEKEKHSEVGDIVVATMGGALCAVGAPLGPIEWLLCGTSEAVAIGEAVTHGVDQAQDYTETKELYRLRQKCAKYY